MLRINKKSLGFIIGLLYYPCMTYQITDTKQGQPLTVSENKTAQNVQKKENKMKEITLKEGQSIQINLPNGSRVSIENAIVDLGFETRSEDFVRVSHFDKQERADKIELKKLQNDSTKLGNSKEIKWHTGHLLYTEKIENEYPNGTKKDVGRTVKTTDVCQTVFYKD